MPTLVSLRQLHNLSHEDSKNELLLDTSKGTELHIVQEGDKTIITLPYGNKFDVVDRQIIIHDINK